MIVSDNSKKSLLSQVGLNLDLFNKSHPAVNTLTFRFMEASKDLIKQNNNYVLPASSDDLPLIFHDYCLLKSAYHYLTLEDGDTRMLNLLQEEYKIASRKMITQMLRNSKPNLLKIARKS